jgi:hypothetical protein
VPSWLDGSPLVLTFGVLFGIVFLRAQGTYWIGRAVTSGLLHSRLADRITGPRTTRAIVALNRWGLPVVTISFLTSFSIDNGSDLRAKARADAVKQAQAQAKQMADAAGVQLGQIHSISETPIDNPMGCDQAMPAP